MFVLTMGKSALRRAGLAVLCLACMAGAVAAVSHFTGDDATAQVNADAEVKIESTQDIGTFFTGHGLEVDLTTAAVDKVKVPRKWDSSFEAFNTVVAQSGFALDKCKGKKVEKWTVLCPGRSDGQTNTYGVLLVYKKKPVGAYLLAKPGGEVTGLSDTQSAAALTAEETAANADFAAEAEETQGMPEEALPEEPAEEAAAEMNEMDEAAEAAEAAAMMDENGWPVE